VTGPVQLLRQTWHYGRDVAELLLNAVLEQLEIFLAKIGDRIPLAVADHRIDHNGRHARCQRLLRRGNRRLLAGGQRRNETTE
jgi:hypothetical protein